VTDRPTRQYIPDSSNAQSSNADLNKPLDKAQQEN
jgi:hypothetical protein